MNASATISGVSLVDAAPWGGVLRELEQLFFQHLSRMDREAAAPPPIGFFQENLAATFGGSPESLLAKLEPEGLNVIFLYRLTWDMGGGGAVAPFFEWLLVSIGRANYRAEIFVADAQRTSDVYRPPPGWQRQVFVEEGRTNKHRNFYCFKQVKR